MRRVPDAELGAHTAVQGERVFPGHQRPRHAHQRHRGPGAPLQCLQHGCTPDVKLRGDTKAACRPCLCQDQAILNWWFRSSVGAHGAAPSVGEDVQREDCAGDDAFKVTGSNIDKPPVTYTRLLPPRGHSAMQVCCTKHPSQLLDAETGSRRSCGCWCRQRCAAASSARAAPPSASLRRTPRPPLGYHRR